MRKNLKLLSNIFIYFILFFIFIYKSVFINAFSNIKYYLNKVDCNNTENIILNAKINNLNNELKELTGLELYAKYNYSLTRMSYRESYSVNDFYIMGGNDKNYQVNNVLINQDGVVGIITDVYDTYSKCTFIYNTNLSVDVNSNYGIISNYKDGLLIIDNISNYDSVNLNDLVYTSTLGSVKEKLLIGYVYKIEDNDYKKRIYVKSDVDYDHISYLYVVGSL